MLPSCRVRCAGDRKVGKYSITKVFGQDTFPEPRLCMVETMILKEVEVYGHFCKVTAIDDIIVGERLTYFGFSRFPVNTNLAIFGVDSRESFDKLRYEWIPELRDLHPDVPIILVANKIDLRDSDECETISAAEGFRLAKEMGTSYREVSAMRFQGIQELFLHAAELANLNTPEMKELLDKTSAIYPPFKPPPAPEPVVKATTSTFVEEWLQIRSDPKFYDVKFLVEGEKQVFSHRIVLCSASSLFTKIFLPSTSSDTPGSFAKDKLNSGAVPGIQKVYDSLDGKEVTVELDTNIKAKTFDKILELMYTGCLCEKFNYADLLELKRVASLFELTRLVSCCDEVLTTKDCENHKYKLVSLDFCNDEKKSSMGEFLRQMTLSDLVVNVNGTNIPGHRVVVCTRSPWMADLVGGASPEGSPVEISVPDVSVDNFLSFLEYLYTDHAHLDNCSDLIGLLTFADNCGAHRLVSLCELHLKKEVDGMLEKVEEGEQINGLELLKKFEACKATRLVDWCRHYICHNYTQFSKKEEFQDFNEEDQDYFRQYQWPPVNYLLELEDFERRLESVNYCERMSTVAEVEKPSQRNEQQKKCILS